MAEASDDAWLQADEIGFPLYFQRYKKKRHKLQPWIDEFWILWNENNEEAEHPPGFLYSSWELKEKIKVLLETFMEYNASEIPISLLIQFWEPVLIEGRTLLTTRHQPFAINSIHEGLCPYRVISESYKFYVDERQSKDELGLLGRVFIHKLPECSPDIEYYTIKEYPQRQDALGCQIKAVNACPVLDPSRQSCIGVLELVMSTDGVSCVTFGCGWNFPSKEKDLKILDLKGHSPWLTGDNDEDFKAAKKEIDEVLENVCEAYKLDLQMWAVCSVCMSNASYTGQLISIRGIEFDYECYFEDFLSVCKSWHLREGQGLVGQALSSRGLIFCSDITQFSIVDYPLAHFAKYYELRCSFAICLRSSRSGSRLYVLEFFLPPNLIVNESLIMLHNILGTMKLHFQTFKLAYGKDLGEKLPIQVVDYRNGEKYDCYTLEVEFLITRSPQSPPGTLQDDGEIMQQDPSSQQSIDKAANAEQSNVNCTLQDEGEMMQQDPSSKQSIDKVANAEQSNINCTSSRRNSISKNLERPQSKTGIQLSFNDIRPHAKKKIADAAEALNVSRSTLKRICREHNINRWPPRNIKEYCSLAQDDDDRQQILRPSYGMPSSSNPVLPTVTLTNSHDTMARDVNFVNVKAKHINDVIKFKLLLSSRLMVLQHEIAKRLKLTVGTYDIKYEDEEKDLVLITCDEDVQDWICTCGSQGGNSLKIFLMPK